MEKTLQTNPEDLAARGRLLAYYYRRPEDASRQFRLRHIAWLIGHHPDSPILYDEAATLDPADFKPPHQGDLAPLVAAWREQVDGHWDDVRVLENEVRVLRQTEYSLTVECLKRLRQIEPTNPRWVVLLASQYVTTLDNPDLASQTQNDLEASKDLPVVGLAGQGLYVMGRKSEAKPLLQYGEWLLKKAQSLDPLNLRWSVSASETPGLLTERDMWPYGAVPAMTVPSDAIRVAPEVQAAKSVHHEQPQCIKGLQVVCPQTKTTLKLDAMIGKDGKVKSLHATSGDMSTIPLAMDAARQWTYQPTLVNGHAVEVATEIDVVLAPAGQATVQPRPLAAPPKGSAFTPPVAITKVEPDYSPEAHAAKFEGSVQLSLMVDEHGLPQDIKVVRRVGMGLDEKAIEAVRKWTFRPGTKDGKPVAVRATVEVQFKSR